MEPALLARIAREVPAARTIKLEDPPTPFKTARILEQARDVGVAIFGGLGGVFLLEELMAGAAGAMTGFAYPAILVKIVMLFRGASQALGYDSARARAARAAQRCMASRDAAVSGGAA